MNLFIAFLFSASLLANEGATETFNKVVSAQEAKTLVPPKKTEEAKPDADLDAAQIQPPPSTWDNTLEAKGDDPEPEPSWTRQIIRTIFGLAFVVTLIYFLFKVGLARLLGVVTPTGTGKGKGKEIVLLERMQLDGKHSLFLVQAAEKRLLLTSGDQGVTVLTHLDSDAPAQDAPASFDKTLMEKQAAEEDAHQS
ncbi:FliO/MopB family protein [Myxococcota bacterium]|nr:FliO/MopB family protein [Myxococcota bacterium]